MRLLFFLVALLTITMLACSDTDPSRPSKPSFTNENEVVNSALAIAAERGLEKLDTPCILTDAAITIARYGMDVVPAENILRPSWTRGTIGNDATYWRCVLTFATGDTTTRVYLPDAIGVFALDVSGVYLTPGGEELVGEPSDKGWTDNLDGVGAIPGLK